MDDLTPEQKADRARNRHYYGRILPGVWLLVIGTIFLLSNFGYLPSEPWAKLWPIFIIIPGIFMLWRPRR